MKTMANSSLQSVKAVVCACAIVLSGCDVEEEPVSSQTIPTRDMSIEAHVSNNMNRSLDVEVMLRYGDLISGRDIYLAESDHLFVSSMGAWDAIDLGGNNFDKLDELSHAYLPLNASGGRAGSFFQQYALWYYQTFPIDQQDKEFTIALERVSNLNADHTKLRLPADYEILSPQSGDTLSRSGPILISWSTDAASDLLLVHAALNCADNTYQSWEARLTTDQASVEIPAAYFQGGNEVCSLNISMDRQKLGQADPVFTQGGLVIGHQIRSLAITTLP